MGISIIQKFAVVATPWLAVLAIALVAVGFLSQCRARSFLADRLERFNAIAPLKKLLAAAVVCLCVWWGGSKERGPLGGGRFLLPQGTGTVQLQVMPEEIASSPDAFRITAFEIDAENETLGFGVAWTNTLFDYTASRNIHLFSSTNLQEQRWSPLGTFAMPWGETSCVFAVTADDVDASVRQRFLDTFAGRGFYTFGIDFDSDGDGLSDAHELLWTLTDPLNADTDGDGLGDGEELAVGTNTNPLLYDTDGDGVGDGDEVVAGTDPHSGDTDGDGLTDLDELGTVRVLPAFQWYETDEGTNLLADEPGDSSWTVYSTSLAYPVTVGTQTYTRVSIDLNGILYLIPTNGTDVGIWDYATGQDLQYWHPDDMTNVAVAACWDRLYALRSLDSSVRVLDVPSNRCTVVEYRCMARADWGDGTNDWATFQVVLPSQTNDIIRVNYLAATPGFLSEVRPAIGILDMSHACYADTNCFYHVQFAYGVTNAVLPRRSLEFRFGTGTNPCKADSDEDGISDPDELIISHTDPLNADTDGDGRTDGVEISGEPHTDPLDPDMDNDGLPDGWEVRWGLNPFCDEDGATVDSDLDGLSNCDEMKHGTNPLSGDTDNDGLDDRTETGWVEFGTSLPQFDVSDGSNVLDAVTSEWNYDTETFTVPIPFVAKLGGVCSSNVTICTDGVVGFLTAGMELYEFYVFGGNDDLADESTVIAQCHSAVAAYWDDLWVRSGTDSRIRVASPTVGTNRWFVVEFVGVAIYDDVGQTDPPSATFQIAICESDPYTVHVRYVSLGSSFDGSSATIGAQGPNRAHNFPVAYEVHGSVTNGMVISYHFGPGSDPCAFDTDGDGLSDAEEMCAGTNPRRRDTDSDGIPDKWEVDHGLDPTDAADGVLDPDGDGLDNRNEYLNGCDPGQLDTDGDGTDDGVEVGHGSDPNDASDGGQTPSAELYRELNFCIDGDWAAWEMTIEGLGPHDTRIRRISMGVPNADQSVDMCVRKGNAYRLTMRWLNCDGHDDECAPWYCWRAQIDGKPSVGTFGNYSNVRLAGNEIVVGNGWIVDNADGLLTDHVHESARNYDGNFGGGNVAEVLSATLYVLEEPQLVPDLDGDGQISASDANLLANGRVFRFWTNDDNDAASTDGDIARGNADDFPVNGQDWDSGHVNGRRDLVDFTPIWLDMSHTVTNLPPSIRNSIVVRLRHSYGAMNAVWSNLERFSANTFQTSDVGGFGPSLNAEARSAETVRIGAAGIELPPLFLQYAREGGDQGVFLVEGRADTTSPLWVEVSYGNNIICSNKLEASLSSVEDMYRWLCLRQVCGDSSGLGSRLGMPFNLPDSECVGPHFIFVHGYSVGVESARGWASEMFKRLWQAGSRTMFTAVDWYGDDSRMGSITPNYYANVMHALDSANAFAIAANGLQGTKRIMAHSLGNMMVCAAAKEHGLVYGKYYMLNAAVPMEAFSSESSPVLQMIPASWRCYSEELYSSYWHGVFAPIDGRYDFGWCGRFAGLQNVVNCYSLTEDVLANPTLDGIGGVWSAQELAKGTGNVYIPLILGCKLNREGGWGFNSQHLVPLSTDELLKTSFTDDELKTSPPFLPFDEDWLFTTNTLLSTATAPVRNRILADGVSATSFAAGSNPLASGCVTGNINFQPTVRSTWPQARIVGGHQLWYHSDIVKLAFFYTAPVFVKILNGDSQ